MSGRKRVIVVGAGFAGLACARALEGAPVDVLLLDRGNYHLFSPLLYQVASALLNPSDIAFPIRKVFRGSPNVRFRRAEVASIDRDARVVHLEEGDALPYDYLVVAAGSTTNFYGNQAVERRALGLKNLPEALELRNHILECLERAAALPAAEQAALMTFVIVGGGPTGIEYAGALAELMRLVKRHEYPRIEVTPRIVLVEGGDQLLGAFSERLGTYTKTRLEKLGVEVRLGAFLEDADPDGVRLSDGTAIACETLVWSAGVKAEGMDGAPTTRSKRIEVDPHLRIEGDPRAFAIGDVAGAADDDGGELPMLSAPAMQQGRYVAAFIVDHLGADAPITSPPFRYFDKGTMATIGRNAAVVDLNGREMTGFVGWVAWLVVHIFYLIGFRNRLVVMWTWCWNYLYYDRPVRIIARARKRTLLDD